MFASPFRSYPSQGAVLLFEPRSGLHVQLVDSSFDHLRRTAPRVVLFGITNACNLACHFCSRDANTKSEWSVDSAFEVLAGLSAAGTLEVAFGGGEPFAFRDFAVLLARLRRETPLAVHATTNGELLDDAMLDRIHGTLDTVRLSVYDDRPWQSCAARLRAHGQRFGANVLVHDAMLQQLPQTLRALADLGAKDAALLSYVGDDPLLHLSGAGRAQLAQIIARSALPIKTSLCMGAVPHTKVLFRSLDVAVRESAACDAGKDFITISSDRHVTACSFHGHRLAFSDANELLEIWRSQNENSFPPGAPSGNSPKGENSKEGLAKAREANAWQQHAGRPGCARPARRPSLPILSQQEPLQGMWPPTPNSNFDVSAVAAPPVQREVRVWVNDAGNNSGDCVLVAQFRTSDEARAFAGRLLPGLLRHAEKKTWHDLPSAWLELFAEAGVNVAPALLPDAVRLVPEPDGLVAIGNTVLATAYGLESEMPELSDYVAKMGAIDHHTKNVFSPVVVFAVDALIDKPPLGSCYIRHYGQRTLGVAAVGGLDLSALQHTLQQYAGGATVVVDVIAGSGSDALARDFAYACSHLRQALAEERVRPQWMMCQWSPASKKEQQRIERLLVTLEADFSSQESERDRFFWAGRPNHYFLQANQQAMLAKHGRLSLRQAQRIAAAGGSVQHIRGTEVFLRIRIKWGSLPSPKGPLEGEKHPARAGKRSKAPRPQLPGFDVDTWRAELASHLPSAGHRGAFDCTLTGDQLCVCLATSSPVAVCAQVDALCQREQRAHATVGLGLSMFVWVNESDVLLLTLAALVGRPEGRSS